MPKPLATQDIGFNTNLAPTASADVFGDVFTVGTRSVVSRLTVTTGESLEATDLFELHTVLDYNKETKAVVRSYAIVEKDPTQDPAVAYNIPLGSEQTQLEIVIRGVYVWKKIVATTLLIGVETTKGYEKVL